MKTGRDAGRDSFNWIFFAGLALAVLWWVFSSLAHIYVFHTAESFLKEVFTRDPHELWMRSFPALLIIIFSAVVVIFFRGKYAAEKQAMLAEEKYRTVVESTDTGLVILDEEGRVLEANAEYVRLTGHGKLDEIKGRSVVEWTADFDRGRNAEEVRKCMEAGCAKDLLIHYKGPSGRIVPIQVYARVIDSDGGKQIVTLCRDARERAKAEKALKEAEIFKRFADAAGQGFGMATFEGNVIYINPALRDMFGEEKAEDAYKKNIRDYYPEDGYRRFEEEIVPVLKERGSWTGESVIVTAKGEAVSVIENIFIIRDEKGEAEFYANILTDITDIKKAEAEIQEARKKWEEIFQAVGHPTMILDKDHNIVEANRALMEIAGKSKEELVGRKCYEIYHDAKEPPENCPMEKLLSSQRFESYEMEAEALKGTFYISCTPMFDQQGEVEKVIHIATDVTERKKAEEALKESEFLLRQVTETIQDVFWVTEWDSKRVIFASRSYEKIWGRTVQSLYDDTEGWAKAIHPDDRERAWERFLNLGKGEDYDEEYRIITPEGNVRWIRDRGYPIQDEQGEVTKVVGVAQDITERRMAQEALRENEEFLQSVFDGIQDGISVLDRDLNIIRTNNWMSERYSSKMPLVGKKCYEAYQERDAVCPWCPSVKTMETGEVNSAVVPYPSEDAPEGWILLSTFPLKDDEGNVTGIIEHVKDVTAEKKAETDLIRTEAELRASIEASPAGILVADAPDVRIRMVNSAALGIRGGEIRELTDIPAEVHPQKWQTFYPDGTPYKGEDLPLSRAILKGETVRNEEVIIRRPDGEDRWVLANSAPVKDKDGNITAGVVVFPDITDLKKAEKNLTESEARFRELFSTMMNAVAIYEAVDDGNDFVFKDLNRAAEKIESVRKDDILGKRVTEVFPGVKEFGLLDKFREAYRTGKTVYHPVTFYKDERIAGWRENYVFKLPAGEIVAIYEDITDKKRAEEELERYRQHLEELVDMRTRELKEANEELESFSYSVSHDLRAPLRAINGFSRILEEDHEDRLDKEGRRVLNVIKDNTVKMGNLIDGLLSFSRLGRKGMKYSVIDMEKLVREEARRQKDTFPERKVLFKTKSMPPAKGDYVLVEQVVANLISNALKFTRSRDKTEIEAGGASEGSENVYYIKDNGTGFDMKYADKLFDVFQRLHSEKEYGGTGVGLAIVQRILRKHGGRVWAEGKPGEGATFYFALPKT